MGLKIVISSSRIAKEKDAVIEKLRELDETRAILGDSPKIIESIYDCEKKATVFGIQPKQDEINELIIPECDWFILIAPIRHVGEITAQEFKFAYNAVKGGKGLVISLFHCINPFGVSDEKYQEALLEHGCLKRDTDVDLKKLLLDIQNAHRQNSKHYVVDYKYTSDFSSLRDYVGSEFLKLVKENKFRTLRIEGLSIKGSNVKAEDLYFDKNRASVCNGFNEGLYLEREAVDGKLKNLINRGSRIIAVTGLPGSGKTRAVYEYITHTLADKNVILMNRNNLCNIIELMKQQANNGEEHFYFVVDQVCDLFMPPYIEKNDIIFFFENVLYNHKNYVFIFTSTSSAYDSFLNNCQPVKELFDRNDKLCVRLEIQPIGKSQDDLEFVNRLKQHYPKIGSGKTVADYIPGLNGYVEKIIERLTEVKDEPLSSYIKLFLKACQLVSVFRYTSPLCLVVMLMYQRYRGKVTEEDFSDNVMKCIYYLRENNAVWISSNELYENSFLYQISQIYDSESMETIVPPDITFSVNELVWNALLERESGPDVKKRLFYRWNESNDVVAAVTWFFNTFPTIMTLRRVVARLPETDNYTACMQKCVDLVIKQKIRQFKGKKEITNIYSLLIGRAHDRKTVDSLIKEMQKQGLQPDETTIGEMIRFSQLRKKKSDTQEDIFTQEEIEDFQKMNNIADNIYSVSRKLECFISDFTEAMKFLKQDGIEQIFARYMSVGSLFTIDYLSLKNIYENLAKLCITADDINMLVQYANNRYEVALQLIESEINYDDIIDIIKVNVRCIFDVGDDLLNSICDITAAKAMLKEYVERLFLLSYSVVYRLIEKVSHNKHLKELLQTYLEEGKGVWSGIKANNRDIVYVGLVRTSKDFATSYAFYNAWKKKDGYHNPQMFSMCLLNCQQHEYKEAVQAFRKLEEDMGADNVSIILYNNLLQISPSLDDAMLFVKNLKFADDYTLSILLGKIKGKKRFVSAYELINMPIFAGVRCSIHAMALLYELAESKEQEQYLDKLIDRDLQENDAIELKEQIATSYQINSMLMRKRYRSLNEAFDLLENYRNRFKETATNGEKMIPDYYSTLLGKIAWWENLKEREDAFEKWDRLIEADWNMIEADEFFYSSLYRYRKLHTLIDDNGEVSAKFRQDIESVDVTKAYIFGNIMSTMQFEKIEFESIWKMYLYYREEFMKRKMEKALRPYPSMFDTLSKAAKGNKEWEKLVEAEKTHFGFDKSNIPPDNSILIHEKLKKVKDVKDVLEMLKGEISSGYLLSCVLNACMNKIAECMNADCMKGKNKLRADCYAEVHKFLDNHPVIYNSFTTLTYVSLLKLATTFEKKQEWLSKLEKQDEWSYKYNEVLCGTVATDFVIANNDIITTRRYFDFWLDIYTDLGLSLDDNFKTLGIYLRIEIENAREGYLKRALEVLHLFVRHKRLVLNDTLKKCSWPELSKKLKDVFPECATTIDKVKIQL